MECFNGEILRGLRKSKGLNQHELAIKVKLVHDSISRLECGYDIDPYLSTVKRLADFFDVSIDLFCDRDNYYYADNISKQIIKLYKKERFNKDITTKALEIYNNINKKENDKRVALVRKIYTADNDWINSIYHLIFN